MDSSSIYSGGTSSTTNASLVGGTNLSEIQPFHPAEASAYTSANLMSSTGQVASAPVAAVGATSVYSAAPASIMHPAAVLPHLRPDYLYLNHVISDSGSNVTTPTVAVTAVTFDQHEELLWTGNETGHVTSHYGLDLVKYTSFQVDLTNDIRSMMTTDYGLLSLTKNALRMSIRRGLTLFHHTSDEYLKDAYCMSKTDNSSIIMIAGRQSEMLLFDLNKRKPLRISRIYEEEEITDTNSNSGCMLIRSHPKYYCCGDASGKITLRDKSSLKSLHTFSSHSGQLSDFDVRGNYLVTCGCSVRNGIFVIDRFLMVYDLRMLKCIAPIRMDLAPYLLRFVPIYSSKFAVVSQTGQFQLLDTTGSSTPPPFLHSVELPHGASITAFDVSDSSQALAFSDNCGFAYLFGASSDVCFNLNSQETEFADEYARYTILPFEDKSIPLSRISPVLPPLDADEFPEPLLSDWPSDLVKKTYRRSKPIDRELLESMKMTGSVGYAPANQFGGGKLNYTSIYRDPLPEDYTEATLATGLSEFLGSNDNDNCTSNSIVGNLLTATVSAAAAPAASSVSTDTSQFNSTVASADDTFAATAAASYNGVVSPDATDALVESETILPHSTASSDDQNSPPKCAIDSATRSLASMSVCESKDSATDNSFPLSPENVFTSTITTPSTSLITRDIDSVVEFKPNFTLQNKGIDSNVSSSSLHHSSEDKDTQLIEQSQQEDVKEGEEEKEDAVKLVEN